MTAYAKYGLLVFAGLLLLGWWVVRRRPATAMAAALLAAVLAVVVVRANLARFTVEARTGQPVRRAARPRRWNRPAQHAGSNSPANGASVRRPRPRPRLVAHALRTRAGS